MKRIIFFVAALLLGAASLDAHTEGTPSHSITITTEGLWNATTGIANWVNLLESDTQIALPFGLDFDLELLAIGNLRMDQGKSGVADNLHLFSAIEDSPSTLALLTFGLEKRLWNDRWMLYVGVRHMGNDYFNSTWNSVFTSAMNALFPSIATNFVVPDAPKAAMAIHAEWQPNQNWHAKLSIYDGVASQLWSELFSLNIRRDGIFTISQAGYSGNKGSLLGTYNIGATYGYAPTVATLAHGERSKSSRASAWMLAEQPLYLWPQGRELYLVLHGAWAPKSDCDTYMGGALVCHSFLLEDDYIGLMLSRGNYGNDHETQVELTYSLPYKYGTLQPALHRVHSSVGNYTIGMLKLTLEL